MNAIKKLSLSFVLISGIATNSSGAQFARKLWQKTPVATIIGISGGYQQWKDIQDIETREPSHSFSDKQVKEIKKIMTRQNLQNVQICDIKVAIPTINTDSTPAAAAIIQKKPTICLSEELVKGLEEEEKRDAALFVLSHEVAHLKKPEEMKTSSRLAIAAIPLPYIAWQCTRFFGYGKIISGLAFCLINKAGFSLQQAYSRKMEKNTDLRAVNADPERIKGGIQFFNRIHSKNSEIFDADKKFIVDNGGFFQAIQLIVKVSILNNMPEQDRKEKVAQLMQNYMSNSVEEFTKKIDPFHPTPLERIAYLKELANKLEKEQEETSK